MDPAIVFMTGCYVLMCLQYGRLKTNESKILKGRTNNIALFCTFVFYTIVAPISVIHDICKD